MIDDHSSTLPAEEGSDPKSGRCARRGASAPGTVDPVTNPDDWQDGLQFRCKTLNTKSVSRAKSFGEVLQVCLSHNLRQQNEAHRHRKIIDRERARLNSVLVGPDDLGQCVAHVHDLFESGPPSPVT